MTSDVRADKRLLAAANLTADLKVRQDSAIERSRRAGINVADGVDFSAPFAGLPVGVEAAEDYADREFERFVKLLSADPGFDGETLGSHYTGPVMRALCIGQIAQRLAFDHEEIKLALETTSGCPARDALAKVAEVLGIKLDED